jgi:hypothetical protein
MRIMIGFKVAHKGKSKVYAIELRWLLLMALALFLLMNDILGG